MPKTPAPDPWLAQMLDRIDPDGWWCFVVCTNKGHHPAEVVGILFEHVARREGPLGHTRGQLHWAARHLYLNEAGTRARPRLVGELLPEEAAEREAAEAGEPGARRIGTGHGSYNVDCPAGCHLRFSRESWRALLSGIENPHGSPHQLFREDVSEDENLRAWSEAVDAARVSRPESVDLSVYA